MKIYELRQEQLLNISREEAWNFLSNPNNLNEITPPSLKFRIVNEIAPKMYSGQIIKYMVEIIPGIKQTWLTEIKNVKEGSYFIDEQRFGPYKFWHHQHIIEKLQGKVNMIDIVNYGVPFGILGRLVHKLFIRPKLIQIFNFRFEYLKKKFNS